MRMPSVSGAKCYHRGGILSTSSDLGGMSVSASCAAASATKI